MDERSSSVSSQSYVDENEYFLKDLLSSKDSKESSYHPDESEENAHYKENMLRIRDESEEDSKDSVSELEKSFFIKEKEKQENLFDEEEIPVVVPKEKAKEEQDLSEQQSTAHVQIYWASRASHELRDEKGPQPNFSSLSLNQQIKREREGNRRKARQRTLKTFQKTRAAKGKEQRKNQENEQGKTKKNPQYFTQEQFDQVAEQFLTLSLDRFHLNNDREFTENLESNYQLVDRAREMRRQMEGVVAGKLVIDEERRKRLYRKILEIEQVGEWMDRKREVMSDPYYALLFKDDLRNYQEILAGLEDEAAGKDLKKVKPEYRKRLKGIRDFLRKVKAVDDCAFKRARFRDANDLAFRNEFTKRVNLLAEEEGKALGRRVIQKKEGDKRAAWGKKAEELLLQKKEIKRPVKGAPATMDLFYEKRREFLSIDLSRLHFSTVDEILEHHAEHEELFASAREMSRILSEVASDELNELPDDMVIPLRARLALFRSLRSRQARVVKGLAGESGELENISLAEWVNQNDLVLVIDPRLEEERLREEFAAANDQADATIRSMYGELRGGVEMLPEKVEEAKKNYQRNLVFWESMESEKTELTLEDEETKAFVLAYYREKKQEPPRLSKLLLLQLRGKNQEDSVRILTRASGSPEEQMALYKELSDQALTGINLERFRLNTGNPAAFAKNISSKLHDAEVLLAASEAVSEIERLRKENPEAVLPEGYDEEYKKELSALSEFAADHIKTRFDALSGMAGKVDRGYLGAMNIRELTELKADRKAIRETLQKPAKEGHQKSSAAASAFFALADQLIKNKLEIGNLKFKDKQKVASVEDKVSPIYQTYRLAYGVKGREDEFDEGKRLIYDQIDAINESPLFSSREELQSLRDRAIATLSEFEPGIEEYLYYDLSTPVLKDLALRKLKENLSKEEILGVIKFQQLAGKKREEEAEHPEWGEKEKDALDLMGDLAGERKKDAAAGENLFALLENHGEILADMVLIAGKDGKEEKKTKERYRELKRKLSEEESLPGILKEEEGLLAEFKERLEKDQKDEKKGKDASYLKYLESQIKSHEKEVASLRSRMEDLKTNKEAYEKELSALSYLEPGEKEIEDQEKALSGYYRRLEEIEEAERNAIGGDPIDIELHEKFRAMDNYERDTRENRKELEGQLEAERSKGENADQKEIERLQGIIDGYDEELDTMAADILALEQQKKNQKAEKEELKKTIEAAEKELTKLKEGPEAPLNVFEAMSRKMEGSEAVLAKSIGEALSAVAKHLYKQTGEKGVKLSNVRSLLRQKDPELMKLLSEADEKIVSAMEKAYGEVSAEIKELSKIMFEDLNNPLEPIVSDVGMQSVGTNDERDAFYLHTYDEKDRKKDQEALEEIREENKQLWKDENRNPEELILLQKKKMNSIGPDALYASQARKVFKFLHYEEQKEPVTLQSLYHKNWYPDQDSKELPGEGAFVQNVMNSYFDKASDADKKSMMTTLVRSLKPKPHDRAHGKTNSLKHAGMYLGGLLKGAGSLVQKMMQGVPSKYLLREVSDAVEDMKSKLTPIPDSYVNQIFQEMIDENKNITDIKKLQSLGAASVAETFLCRVYGPNFPDGKQVVIKILRPEAKERIDREEGVMKDCAKATSEGMLKTYEGQLLKIREELDFTKEAKNIEEGVKAYEKEVEGVPGVSSSVHALAEIAPKEKYLVMDKAEGENLDRFTLKLSKNRELYKKPFYQISKDRYGGGFHIDPVMKLSSKNIGKLPESRSKLVGQLNSVVKKKVHLEKATELWIRESIFGDGFYHGDMHAGNIMISDEKATILDYGNATKLTKDQVNGICALSAAAMYNDARTFLDRFLLLLPKEEQRHLSGEDLEDPEAAFEQLKKFTIQKNELRQKLYDIFKLGTEAQSADKMKLALTELQKHGFQIPISIHSYVQSQIRLSNALDDLNAEELGLRQDLRCMDHMQPVDGTGRQMDFMILAQNGAKDSQNPENYYRGLLSAIEAPDEEDFVGKLLSKEKDQDGKTEFEKKYMHKYDALNDLMDGKAEYNLADEDDEPEMAPVPVPVIDIADWKKDYEAYLPLLAGKKQAEAEHQERVDRGEHKGVDMSIMMRDPRYIAWNKAKEALNTKITNSFSMDGLRPNGLLEGFGNFYELSATVGDALLGKKQAFDGLMELFENTVLPSIQLARDLREFIKKGGSKEKAKELFQRYKAVQGTMSNRNQVIFDIRKAISFDRMASNDEEEPANVAKNGAKEYDTTQFKQLLPEWNALKEKKEKEGLSDPEKARFAKIGVDLVQSRYVGLNIRGAKGNMLHEEMLSPWFLDKEDGKELYLAYQEFRKLREADMEKRDKKWDDDTLLPERTKAEQRFLEIYKRIANRRLKAHVKAYEQKVPEEKKLRGFNEIFSDVVNSGARIPFVGLTANMVKIGTAVGIAKAKAYDSGDFKPGLDLLDTIPEKIGDQPQPILKEAENEA